MRFPMSVLPSALLLQAAAAAPWACDLETTLPALPWVYLADILSVDVEGVDFLVTESLRGEGLPGDTLRAGYWEMGSCTGELLHPGEGYLLIPDTTGDLQVVGVPGGGWWLLQGEFDFNAFWTRPGVLSREELDLLCAGDTLPPRTVRAEIRFAGRGDVLEVGFRETERGWESRSETPWLDGLELEGWELALGGEGSYPDRPPVAVVLRTSGGARPELLGRVDRGEGSAWRCTVFPASPVILSPEALDAYLSEDVLPEPPVLDVEVTGADPADLGLAEDPWITVDERGRLLLSGADGMLEITSLYTDGSRRPSVGFDVPGTCHDPLYFRFENLPEGPSGHLATDILDVLEKGIVTGSLSPDGDPAAPRFALRLRRDVP